jgi:hypothetical protein
MQNGRQKGQQSAYFEKKNWFYALKSIYIIDPNKRQFYTPCLNFKISVTGGHCDYASWAPNKTSYVTGYRLTHTLHLTCPFLVQVLSDLFKGLRQLTKLSTSKIIRITGDKRVNENRALLESCWQRNKKVLVEISVPLSVNIGFRGLAASYVKAIPKFLGLNINPLVAQKWLSAM